MPLVTTTISYAGEEYGRREASSFQREVEDLDVNDALWHCVKTLEIMGFDCAQLMMVSSDNKVYKTDW